MKLSPIIKVPGGKTKLLPVLMQNLPNLEDTTTYVEPFFGGGALFLHLKSLEKQLFKEYIINDLNPDIFNLMETVKSEPEKLMCLLNIHKDTHDKIGKLSFDGIKTTFVKYDSLAPDVDRAARFVYLDKTCFNGLIRYNSKGIFNSPMGDYKNPSLYNKEDIVNCSLALKKVKISNFDFDALMSNLLKRGKINNKTFVYLDPPYIPESLTANFTSYTSNGFSTYDHYRLKASVDFLDKAGCKFLMSNSDTPLTRDLYKNYNIIEVSNIRNISCKTHSRGNKLELLIRNY